MDPSNEIEKIKEEYKLRRTLKAIEAINISPSCSTAFEEFSREASVGSLYATGTGLFICYGRVDGETLWRKVDSKLQ